MIKVRILAQNFDSTAVVEAKADDNDKGTVWVELAEVAAIAEQGTATRHLYINALTGPRNNRMIPFFRGYGKTEWEEVK